MKVERRTGTDERRILTAMIVDPNVLGRITSMFDRQDFRSKWSSEVAQWCVDYWERFELAPGRSIQGIFEKWARDNQTQDGIITSMESFLHTLNDEYDGTPENPDYIVNMAGALFNQTKIILLRDEIESCIDSGRIDEAQEAITNHRKKEMGIGSGIDVFQDKDAAKRVGAISMETLIEYPGALGRFFGNTFCRDSFTAFMGPEKRGKSFWLEDVCVRALESRRRVAWIEAGDMSEPQVLKRLMERMARRPMGKAKYQYPKRLRVEWDFESKKIDLDVSFVTRKPDEPMEWGEGFDAFQRFQSHYIRSESSYFKLACYPNDTLSPPMIENILDEWDVQQQWVPDVLVIDYADILAPIHHGDEERTATNKIWKRLRSISQSRSIALVTATQADAASYEAKRLGMKNFTDDKRKLSHVTGTVGINQTEAEKEQQVQRLNWVVQRNMDFKASRDVYVAGCLAIANPALLSTFRKKDD